MGVIKHVFSNAIADGTNTDIVRPSDWNSLHAYTLQDAVSLGGNTSGVLALISAGLLFLAGGSNITLSQNGNSVTVSAADAPAPPVFSNSNGVSFGTNGATVTATVQTNYQAPGAYLTTAALSQDSSKYAGTNGAITGGSITVNTSGVSVNLPAYLTTAQPPGAYLTTAMLSNAVTLSNVRVSGGTTSNLLSAVTFGDAGGVSFGLDGSVMTAAAPVGAPSPVNFSAGTTSGNLASVVFSNSNGVSFGINGSTITGTVATNYQSQGAYLTTAMQSASSSVFAKTGFTTTTVAGAVVAGTQNTDGLKLAVPAFLTTAQAPGAYLTTAALSQDSSKYAFTGFTTTTVAGAVVAGTHNTDGLKLAVPAYLTTAMLSNAATISNVKMSAGATSGTRSDFTFADSNGISFGYSTNGVITATVKTDYQTAGAYLTTAALSNHSHGNPTLNLTNLSGTTGSNSAGFTLSLSAAAPGGGGAVNFSAGTTSSDLQSVVFSNSNGVSFGLNGSTITASVVGVPLPDRQMFEIMDGERLTTACNVTGASFSKRPIFVPFWIDGNSLSCKTVRFIVAPAAAAASLNITMGIGFYSMPNTSSLALAFSTSNAFSLTTSAQWSGIRAMDITGLTNATHTLSEGRWILGVYVSGSNNSTVVMNMALYGGDAINNVGFILAGTNSTAATAVNSRLFPFWGVYSNTTAAFPANVPLADVHGGASGRQADIYAAIFEIAP